ncbi:hypothetical protein DSO57_1011371 [Entomophthora muscae]|uniref:Uncharacterized protein n=1 Tax=Entomophthora muscae TaxID=34485 RepID=A0ACC2SV61_9FUNG|nr:hypothetical protein DSO57_1011371 [Entomophthora muscae]
MTTPSIHSLATIQDTLGDWWTGTPHPAPLTQVLAEWAEDLPFCWLRNLALGVVSAALPQTPCCSTCLSPLILRPWPVRPLPPVVCPALPPLMLVAAVMKQLSALSERPYRSIMVPLLAQHYLLQVSYHPAPPESAPHSLP